MATNQFNAALIADAVCAVASSRAPYYEHAPFGPLAEGCRQAATLGYLNPVGNGVVQITEAGKQLAQEPASEEAALAAIYRAN